MISSGHRSTMPGEWTLELPHHPTSPARARAFVQRLCGEAGLPEELCDSAALLTSETVTNAYVHAHSGARIAVSPDSNGLLVEVRDDDARAPLRPADDSEATGGRGLAIVAELADEWGTYATPGGKVVWFRLGAIDDRELRHPLWHEMTTGVPAGSRLAAATIGKCPGTGPAAGPPLQEFTCPASSRSSRKTTARWKRCSSSWKTPSRTRSTDSSNR